MTPLKKRFYQHYQDSTHQQRHSLDPTF
jgi:hypothetical protein